jgi:hypothetical protein
MDQRLSAAAPGARPFFSERASRTKPPPQLAFALSEGTADQVEQPSVQPRRSIRSSASRHRYAPAPCSDGDGAHDDEPTEGGAKDGPDDRQDGSDVGGGTDDEAYDDEAKPAAKRNRMANGNGSGREAKRARAQTPKGGKCAHGRQRSRCKECGGASICSHGRRRYQCKECGGPGICAHGRVRSRCKECGGAGICAHGRQRHGCKECGGAGICTHGRVRSRCKECGGASICVHGRRRSQCKECWGTSICSHGRRRDRCKECGATKAYETVQAFAEYELTELEHDLVKATAERADLLTKRVTTENLNRIDALDTSIEVKRRLISEKKSAIERAREGEAARIIDDKRARETMEAEWRQSQALVAAAALDRSRTEEKLDELRAEVDQLSQKVDDCSVLMNALSDTREQGDYRNEFIRPLVSRLEDVRKLISALEVQLAQHGPPAGSHESSSSRTGTGTDAWIAVNCDHPRDEHVPVGDKRCDGCGKGCGKGSVWHQSAMFLCTSESCAVSVCADCHGVLNARQARKRSLQCAG